MIEMNAIGGSREIGGGGGFCDVVEWRDRKKKERKKLKLWNFEAVLLFV